MRNKVQLKQKTTESYFFDTESLSYHQLNFTKL